MTPSPQEIDAAARAQWESDRRAAVGMLSGLESDVARTIAALEELNIVGPDDRAAFDLSRAVDDLLDRATRFTVEQGFDDSMPPEDQPLGDLQV